MPKIAGLVDWTDRYLQASARYWGVWTPRVAFAFGGAWALTGYQWPVAAVGFATVPLVRITVDRSASVPVAVVEPPVEVADAGV